LATSNRRLERNEDKETALGDLVADSLRAAANADIGIVNGGGIRGNLPQGKITYGDVFEVLPFENKVAVLRMTGKQLKAFLRVAESGAMGTFPVSGLRLTLNSCKQCPTEDLDRNGRIDPWETDRLIKVTRSDGSPIVDDVEYTVATSDFLTIGGDYMGWPVEQLAVENIRSMQLLMRDALADYLKSRGRIDGPMTEPPIGTRRARIEWVRREAE
jgi:5'-nucleotidase